MYEAYFGLSERPFSIAPDPHYLYMSEQHKEAMAHLRYGVAQGGGFILLTGEVGTGKTTLCRNLLNDLPEDVDIALILNADLQKDELLQTVCDELNIAYQQGDTQKALLDRLNQYLLDSFANDRKTVLIIDEAQLLAPEVLEQVRLLTNLETTKTKLLQIILIGQPELNELLKRRDLRQLAQRITARYHLRSIDKKNLTDYVTYRLKVAGCVQPLFTRQALSCIYKLTNGIPRLINVLCDHALLVAYANNSPLVNAKMVSQASVEMMLGEHPSIVQRMRGILASSRKWLAPAVLASLLVAVVLWQWPNIQQWQQSYNESLASDQSDDTPAIREEGSAATKPDVTQGSSSSESLASSVPAEKEGDQADNAVVPAGEANSVIGDAGGVSDDQQPASEPAELTAQEDGEQVLQTPVAANLSELLDAAGGDTSRVQAFRYLAELWGKPLPDVLLNSFCEEVRNLRLDCFGDEQASLQELRQYNRPAILVLTTDSGEHRAILKRFNGDNVVLQIGNTDHTLALAEVQSYWSGRYLLFWQPPDIGYRILVEGADSPAVVWLRQQVHFALLRNKLPGLANTSNSFYGADLTDSIRQLQSRYGLVPDGQVGIQTYMLLNEMLNAEATPTLTMADIDGTLTNRQ